MKQTMTLIIAIIFLSSCHPQGKAPANDNSKTSRGISYRTITLTDTISKFITIDTANKMLQSYLNSIDYTANDSDLHAIIFDAGMLRELLSNQDVSKVKIMFAHTLPYINGGGVNTNCGYRSGELTVIIAGYNSSGNYLYTDNKVLEMGSPCPPSCPVSGTASDDLFPALTIPFGN